MKQIAIYFVRAPEGVQRMEVGRSVKWLTLEGKILMLLEQKDQGYHRVYFYERQLQQGNERGVAALNAGYQWLDFYRDLPPIL